MDYSLIVLVGLIVAALGVATKLHSRASSERQGSDYQRVFSTAAIGLLFTVAGVIGWDLRHGHGWFQGTTWVDGPVWWQVGTGVVSLMLSVFFARRVSRRSVRR
jgi:H+/Cl- antiporter ClcA